jgi:uncharacterized protein (TIGR00725 family)
MSSKYQICVSGASKGDSVEQGKNLAIDLGGHIARAGHALLTGATTGLPDTAAQGYKKAGGHMSLGISPASTKAEHVLKYRLPTAGYDAILYSGLHYVGRDALLINSADAVVSIGGRLGTLHEFTIAMETKTPIGFLQGAGGISTEIKDLLTIANASEDLIIFESDPEELINKLTNLLDELNKPYRSVYES